jgi:hypothetical protein
MAGKPRDEERDGPVRMHQIRVDKDGRTHYFHVAIVRKRKTDERKDRHYGTDR